MAEVTVLELLGRLKIDATQWNKSINTISKKMERWGTAMFFVGSRITAGITLPLLGLARAAIKAGAEFDQAMTESLAIISHVNPQIRRSMEDTAKKIALTTKFSSKEAAEAYFFLASSGLNAAESMRALPVAAQFAQAGVIGLEKATELLSDAYISLGLRADDPIENMMNMRRVADVLTEANNMAQGSILEFAEALTNRAAVAMKTFNIDLEEGVAVLAAFAERGIKGKKAGQQFFIVVRDLQRAFQKLPEVWNRVLGKGSVFDEGTGSFNNLADIIEVLEKKLEGMSAAGKKSTLTMLGFQERSLQATLAIVGASGRIREFQEAFNNAGGVVERVANLQMLSFSNQMHVVNERITQVKQSLFETFRPAFEQILLPQVQKGITALEDFVRWLDNLSTAAKANFLAIGSGIAAFGPALAVLGSFTLLVRGLGPLIKSLAVPLVMVYSALKDVGIVIRITNLGLANFWAGALLIISPLTKVIAAYYLVTYAIEFFTDMMNKSEETINKHIDVLEIETAVLERSLKVFKELNIVGPLTEQQTRDLASAELMLANALGIAVEGFQSELDIGTDLLGVIQNQIDLRRQLAAEEKAAADAAVMNAIRELNAQQNLIDAILSGTQSVNEVGRVTGPWDRTSGAWGAGVPGERAPSVTADMSPAARLLAEEARRLEVLPDLYEKLGELKAELTAATEAQTLTYGKYGQAINSVVDSTTALSKVTELTEEQRAEEEAQLEALKQSTIDYQQSLVDWGKKLAGLYTGDFKKFLETFDLMDEEMLANTVTAENVWREYKKIRDELLVLPEAIEAYTTELRLAEEAEKFAATQAGKFVNALFNVETKYEDILTHQEEFTQALSDIEGAIPVSFFEEHGKTIEMLAVRFGSRLGPALREVKDRYFEWAIAAERSSSRATSATANSVKFIKEKNEDMFATLISKQSELALFSLSTRDKELVGLRKGYAEMELRYARHIEDMWAQTSSLTGKEKEAQVKKILEAQNFGNAILEVEKKIGLIRLAEAIGIDKRIIENMERMSVEQIEIIVETADDTRGYMENWRDSMNIIGDLGGLFSTIGGQFEGLGAFITISTTQAKAFGEAWQVVKNETVDGALRAMAAIGMATAAVEAFKAVSEMKGKGKRVAGGAMAGAQMGSVFGPWGTVVGAGLGVIAGAVMDDPAWVKIQDTIRDKMQVHVSDQLAQSIADTAEQMGSHWGAALLHLNEVIAEQGGITAANVDKWTAEVRDAFSLTEFGALTLAEATEVLDENFAALAEAGTLTSGVLKANVVELMALDEQFGTNSESILKFKDAMMDLAATGLHQFTLGVGQMREGLEKGFEAALADAKELNDQMMNNQIDQAKLLKLSSREIDLIREEFAQKWEQTETEMRESFRQKFTDEIKADWQELNDFTELTFFAMKESGMSFLDILDALDPELEELIKLVTEAGAEGGEAIEQLMRIKEFKEENKGLINQIEGLNDLMVGLANSGMMSQESFTRFTSAAIRQFESLTAAGLVENEALMLMAPSLEVLRDLVKEYGLEVDEDTQKILDLAEANGVLKEQGEDTNTLMLQGIRAMTEGIGVLIEIFEGDVPDSIRNMTDVMRNQAGTQDEIWTQHRRNVIEDIDRVYRAHEKANEESEINLRDSLHTMGGDYDHWVKEINRALGDIDTPTTTLNVDVKWGEIPPIDFGLGLNVIGAQHGGIISRPGLFLGGEGGQPEMIGPVSFMTDALRGALSEIGPTPSDAELLDEMRGLRQDLKLMPLHLRDAIILSN